jgi:hypothetical protein
MKKILALLLFLMSVSVVTAQYQRQTIKGKVVDKDTQQPVPDAIVQYGQTSSDYVYTGANGLFEIPAISNDYVYFQCFGYKSRSVLKTDIQKTGTVELELNPISLNPVIISPGLANELLEKAMINTKKNLLQDQPITYLLHLLRVESSSIFKNEIYMEYNATLSKKELKKQMKNESIPYELDLIHISHLQKSDFPPSDLYGAEYHASHLFTFGDSKNNETMLSYTKDSTSMLLEIKPLEGSSGWAKGQVYINKADMTISSIEIESVDSILEAMPFKKYKDKEYKIVRKTGNYQFEKVNGQYYMTDCYTFYRFCNIDEYGRKEYITYQCDAYAVELDNKKRNRRKLSGYVQELFYFPDSTKREFWKD